MERVSESKVKSIESITYYYTETQEKVIKSISFDDKQKRIVLEKRYNQNSNMLIFYDENELVTDVYTFGEGGFLKSRGTFVYDEKGEHIESKNEMYKENVHIRTIINKDWGVIMKKVEGFLNENKSFTEKSIDFTKNEDILYLSGTKSLYGERGNEIKRVEERGGKVFITEHTIEYY